MIERWFPCAEVSECSAGRGWGSGFAEKSLYTWFASRPLAQAKAAVICSLLPWPNEEKEQGRLKKLVREAMEGYDANNTELRDELAEHYPDGAKMCDPFSGRAMIPLEAARLGISAWGIDYSPVATLAGRLLAEYPLRDWDSEPDLPFDSYQQHKTQHFTEPRLLRDVGFVLDLVGDRYMAEMGEFYPIVNGQRPWGYVWAVTLPCANCGNRFPLTGSLKLRNPKTKKRPKADDPGQSYRIVADTASGTFRAEVHDGPPASQPTLVKVAGKRGKTAVCCFCAHAHPLDTVKRMMRDHLHDDAMLVVADFDDNVGKRYREPTDADIAPLKAVGAALKAESPFRPELPAVPTEKLDTGLSAFIGPAGYGYQSWGDLCNDRQTLGFVRLARIIDNTHQEMVAAGISQDYAMALTGYAASNLVRRMKYSTRSATLQIPEKAVGHIYFNDSGISHSFDYFETGCRDGPATWWSFVTQTMRYLARQLGRAEGKPAVIQRGSAMELPLPDGSLDAVVTDPPYDAMINYCDSSDLMFVWLKRALVTADPWFGVTTDPDGLQEKTNEAVIKFGTVGDDHRTEEHYKSCITKAFDQARMKVGSEGVVSIVFGHGDPDAWARVLTAISDAGLVLTGSWPCSTEKGGKQTGEYIDNTIMMACRAAARSRPVGDVRRVDDEVRAEIARRVPEWTADGLADSDQRMAAIAPAMEVVGRYSEVRDFTGVPVPIQHYLGLAHKAVEEAANVRIDKFRLADFDERTRFAISWVRQHGRRVAAASEARWQRLSYDMSDSDVEGIIVKEKGGSRFAYGDESAPDLNLHRSSAVVDIALAVAAEGRSLSDIADALHLLDRENDEMLWAAMTELARLVGEGDRDGQIWAWAVRNRQLICGQAQRARTEHQKELDYKAAQDSQTRLF
jgi:adenine-specific DNA methylase